MRYAIKSIAGNIENMSSCGTCANLLELANTYPKTANLYLANLERHLHFKHGMGYYVVDINSAVPYFT